MLRIKESEDFGMGFNCMTRLYMDRYDEEILVDMIKLCEEYLKWFSHRTIICSLRDLIQQAVGKEKQRARYRELREIVNRVEDDIGVTNSRWGKEKNFDRDTFYQWVKENGLTDEVAIKEVKEDEMLPLKKEYVPLFYKVCNYMIDYSYGRHTYMPSTCRSFVKANMELMSDEALTDIVDSLYTQKDCLHMYYQLMGIERYLLSIPADGNVKRLLKQMELAKKELGEKRVEFFEKEEGQLYEKIGEGVYQRKR